MKDEIESIEEQDFSSIGKSNNKAKKSGIPTDAYNRKTLTTSHLLVEIAERVSGIEFGSFVIGQLLNTIGNKDEKLKEFLVQNQNLTKEFSKPTTVKDANQNIADLNKVREYLNTKFKTNLNILSQAVETEKQV